MDLIDTVAGLLLRNDLIGRVKENGEWESIFKYEWEEKRNDMGDITIGDCNTSESFRLCEEEARRLFPGQEVYPLYLTISTDKTELTKFGMTYTFLL